MHHRLQGRDLLKTKRIWIAALLLWFVGINTVEATQTAQEMQAQIEVRTKIVETLEKPEGLRYEIAEAISDGTFTVISEHETLSDAMNALAKKSGDDFVIRDRERFVGNGVVFMERGMVITAPAKTKDLVLLTYGEGEYNCYTGGGYDAGYVSGDGKNVSIELMGMKGSVKTTQKAEPVDQVELIPYTQIDEMSYYENKEGMLTHVFQIYAYSGETNTWDAQSTRISLGPSPEFLESGVPYFSYDAHTFYRDPERTDAVGTFEPYFKSLPFRTKTQYTAEELDLYITSWNLPNSKLNGIGKEVKRVEQDYGINAAMLLAMAMHESSRGMSEIAQTKNNLFGVRATDENPLDNAIEFKTVSEALEYQAKVVLSENYLNPIDSWRYYGSHFGDKKAGINVKYASDPYWGEKITGSLVQMDTFLGNKDIGQYTIGWTKGAVEAFPDETLSGEALYGFQNIDGAFPQSVPLVILTEGRFDYCVQSILPTDGITSGADLPYDWNLPVYVDKKLVTVAHTGIGGIENRYKPAEILRLYGGDRYETAVAIAKQRMQKATMVILANGVSQIDALSAAPLAKQYEAPLLLTRGKEVEQTLREELERLEPTHVILIGGYTSISPEMENELSNSYHVERLMGKNRYETSAVIAKRLQKKTSSKDHVFLANAISAVDALSIGPIAAEYSIPILLTNGTSLEPSVAEVLQDKDRITAIGGKTSVSPELYDLLRKNARIERIFGANRYLTSVAIAKRYYPNAEGVVFATGEKLADGLSGAPLAADYHAPLLLVHQELPADALSYLEGKAIRHVFVLGGENSVSSELMEEIIDFFTE